MIATAGGSAGSRSRYPRELAAGQLLLQLATARFPNERFVQHDLGPADIHALRSLRTRVRYLERTEVRSILANATSAITYCDAVAMRLTLMAYAEVLIGDQEYERAEKVLARAILLRIAESRAYERRGFCELQRAQFRDALVSYFTAAMIAAVLDDKPCELRARIGQAMAGAALGDLREAMRMLDAVVDDAEKDPDCHAELSRARADRAALETRAGDAVLDFGHHRRLMAHTVDALRRFVEAELDPSIQSPTLTLLPDDARRRGASIEAVDPHA
jgi:tetratricopeptide (TPR) repeat protein